LATSQLHLQLRITKLKFFFIFYK